MPLASPQMYDMVTDLQRASVRPSTDPSKASISPAAVAHAPLRRLPGTATIPGRPIMQYRPQIYIYIYIYYIVADEPPYRWKQT